MIHFYRCIIVFVSLLFLQLLCVQKLFSQVSDGTLDADNEQEIRSVNRAPSVFLDCAFCDFNYIRNEITFVNYVRDPEQADIHVFITQTPTVRGGVEYTFSFIGLRSFSSIRFDLVHMTNRSDTEQEILDALIGLSKAGLTPFLSQTPLVSSLTIGVDVVEGESTGFSRS